MTSNPIFRGVATALITPLNADGIDYEAFGRLLDDQIANGIPALVIAGTTGEGATLSDEEHRALVEYAVNRVAGRACVIAGTGSNDTAYAVSLTKFCCEVGADAMLVVTPYYNKATQNGLVKMYETIADASTKPIIVYNVPSRTGVGIQPATYARLAEHPNIRAIKEANGNISAIAETMALVGDKLDVYSGEDGLTVPILSMGGKGTISVLSNVAPKQSVAITNACLRGDYAAAAKMQCDLLPLINALFSEVNPIPAKAATAALGFGEDVLRLPLTPMEDAARCKLYEEMRKLGIEV